MKKAALFLFLIFPAILPAKQKVIAYYDLDSVIQLVPRFMEIKDSLQLVRSYLDVQQSKLDDEVLQKSYALEHDSASWSPVVKALRIAELSRLRIAQQSFGNDEETELENSEIFYREHILLPLKQLLDQLCLSKKYSAAFESTSAFFVADDCTKKCITNELAGMALLKTE